MHLGDVLTGHGFDYKAVVIAGQEAVAETTLGVAVEWGAPRQRVLYKYIQVQNTNFTSSFTFALTVVSSSLKCLTW